MQRITSRWLRHYLRVQRLRRRRGASRNGYGKSDATAMSALLPLYPRNGMSVWCQGQTSAYVTASIKGYRNTSYDFEKIFG
jgi:hypothetical protein